MTLRPLIPLKRLNVHRAASVLFAAGSHATSVFEAGLGLPTGTSDSYRGYMRILYLDKEVLTA